MNARGALLLLPLSWAVSCGGRYLEPGETTYDVGGASQSGGTAPAPAGKGGSGKGGTSTAGSGNVGGGCACDPIACGPGYVAVLDDSGCCYRCELDLTACATAREEYAQVRQQLLDKYRTLTCQTSSDCGIYYEMNACGTGCGIVVLSAAVKDLESNLTAQAAASCSPDCPAGPTPLCLPPPAPLCLEGACR